MNRADQINAAAQAIRIEDGLHAMGAGMLAEVVIDAVLPQVSTSGELAALAPGSIVVSHNGYPFEVTREGLALGGEDAGTFASVAETFAPLTVVWTPDA